jgi:RNA polymerase sigma-70 factor (ECF subfamily)
VWVDTGWADVYAGQYRRLVGLLTALAGSQAEAEEAVQEAFVRALGLTGRRAVVDDPEAWLYRVAVNVLRSRWRRVLAGRRATERLSPPDGVGRDAVAGVDARMELLHAMRRLPFVQREALTLHYLADLPLDTIAARLGIPLGTVKARLSRGRASLARLLTEESVSEPAPGTPARKGDADA